MVQDPVANGSLVSHTPCNVKGAAYFNERHGSQNNQEEGTDGSEEVNRSKVEVIRTEPQRPDRTFRRHGISNRKGKCEGTFLPLVARALIAGVRG